jgi:hypothetical protein
MPKSKYTKLPDVVITGDLYNEFWLNSDQVNDLPKEVVTQVTGFIVDQSNQLLLVKEKDWTIPGGKPEAGEIFLQTLEREVLEEACTYIDIEKTVLLGGLYFTLKDSELEKVKQQKYFLQLRFFGRIKSMDKFIQNFETTQRSLVKLIDLPKYITWFNDPSFQIQYKEFLSKINL